MIAPIATITAQDSHEGQGPSPGDLNGSSGLCSAFRTTARL